MSSNSGRVPKLQDDTSEEKMKTSIKRMKKCQMSLIPPRMVAMSTPVLGCTAVALIMRMSISIMMMNPAFCNASSAARRSRSVSTAAKNASTLFCTVSELSRNGTSTKSFTICLASFSDLSCVRYLTTPYATRAPTCTQSYTTSPKLPRSHPMSGKSRFTQYRLKKIKTFNNAVMAHSVKKTIHKISAVSRCLAPRNPKC
mmetsp:Transcript_46273/g.94620  ORF Transcript_46273/g.94620 Transcript_46273/m.94620 type:complete len:200 (-) Transcript_46273:1874-2473(-)